ncbi:MAG TPA: hypothetical protein PLP29_07305 [Candidatus Ozemobacteraceae bacterium]|nr:hypothetical protein [Candidatus Ozemobacteraceae bacterium]
MDTFSLTFGYLCFILALQVLRRRSPAMLPHLAAFAILPILSLTLDFDGVSGRHETAFTAGFLGILAVHLTLLVLVNRSWAVQAAATHPDGFPTGVTGRERLKFLLAGIALFLVHRQYERPELSLYEQLDRGAFWLLLLLVGVSAAWSFFRHRHASKRGIGVCLGIAMVLGAEAAFAAPAGLSAAEELTALLDLSHRAAERHERWHSSVEPAISEGCPALVALFTVAKRTEEVFLSQAGVRVRELGGVPVKIRLIHPEKYFSSQDNLSLAIGLLERDRKTFVVPTTRDSVSASFPPGHAIAACPKILEWLHDRCRALQAAPGVWSWWRDEYLVCSICGMPRSLPGPTVCCVCGAGYLDALRIR